MNETMATNEKQQELLAAAVALLVPGERGKDYTRLREAVEAVERCATRKSLDWILTRVSDEQESYWPSFKGTPYVQIYEGHWDALNEAIKCWNELHREGDVDDDG